MKHWFTLLSLLLLMPLAHAGFDEGIEYRELASPQPVDGKGIEVRELFWYGCPHCYHLESELDKWLEKKPADVDFVRMPAVLGPSWELLGRAYYAAQMLGVLDRIHQPLFDRLHKDKKPIRTVDELRAFFVEQGVPAEDFDKTYGSFAVITRTNRGKQVRELYGVSGVPTLIVNGKYVVTARMAGGNDKMLEVVDYLVAKERKAAAKDAVPAAAKQAAQ
ncbi:MAG TPA: thiol:disulfide interchange protein DsbA/DsbL [Gammaproteobacteria bacterium]|nr:thiol:disulfide interchange protein DsbA/DsbL [Gammaproteobacteria bacterium]